MDYAELLAVVKELIADTGRACKFEVLSAAPANEATPWDGPGEPTPALQLTTVATFVPPSGLGLGAGFITEDMRKNCSQVCLVAPVAAFALDRATSIQDGGRRWRVTWVQLLKPSTTALLYAIGVAE